MSGQQLPQPYTDCLVMHKSGVARVARLNGNGTHWQLASYGAVKRVYVWPVADCTAWQDVNLQAFWEKNDGPALQS